MKLLTKSARYASSEAIKKKIDTWLRQGNNPFDAVNNRILLFDALDMYVTYTETRVRKRTWYTYRNYAKTIREFLKKKNILNLRVQDFNENTANEFFEWLKQSKKLKNRSYNNYRTHIKAIFSFFIERRIIDFNPIKFIKKLEVEQSGITALTQAELKIMKEYMPEENYRLYAVAMLVFYCFMRPQEIVRMRVEQIDLVHQRIYLDGKTTKNKKTQVVVIPDPLLEVLVKLKNLDAPSNYYVFSRKLLPGTKEIAPTRIARLWREWANKHGIEKNIYHLKHTGAGMAIQIGINVRDLQLQLRHHSLDETQKYLEKFSNIASDRLKSAFPRF